MLSHFLALAYGRLSFIGFFFLGGLLLESIAPVRKVPLRERVFNCMCGALFLIADILFALYLMSLVAPVLQHPIIRSLSPIITSSPSDLSWFFCGFRYATF